MLEESQNLGRLRPLIHIVDGLDPDHTALRLSSRVGKTDAVGVVALDHLSIRAGIEDLSASAIPVTMLVSVIPSLHKAGYVGIDNRSAGRLAGLLMGRFLHLDRGHNVVVAIGSPSYRGHEESEMRFKSNLAYAESQRILTRQPPLAIYYVGSGDQGIAQALKEANIARETVFIAHDLISATKMMLLNRTLDALIDLNPREVVKLLASPVRGSAEPSCPPRLQVVFAENLPPLQAGLWRAGSAMGIGAHDQEEAGCRHHHTRQLIKRQSFAKQPHAQHGHQQDL